MLGTLYYQGEGVQKDYVQAAYWIKKVAEQGNAEAQRILGSMYHDGKGVPKDDKQAAYWLKKATAQGDKVAQQLLRAYF